MSKSTISPDGEWHVHMDELKHDLHHSSPMGTWYQGPDRGINFVLTRRDFKHDARRDDRKAWLLSIDNRWADFRCQLYKSPARGGRPIGHFKSHPRFPIRDEPGLPTTYDLGSVEGRAGRCYARLDPHVAGPSWASHGDRER